MNHLTSTQYEIVQHLDTLGFVHRRLSIVDVRAGRSFVPAEDFDSNFPTVIVTFQDDDSTSVTVSPQDYEDTLWSARFDSDVPAHNVAAFVASTL